MQLCVKMSIRKAICVITVTNVSRVLIYASRVMKVNPVDFTERRWDIYTSLLVKQGNCSESCQVYAPTYAFLKKK